MTAMTTKRNRVVSVILSGIMLVTVALFVGLRPHAADSEEYLATFNVASPDQSFYGYAYGYLNDAGEVAIPAQYCTAADFGEYGLAAVLQKNTDTAVQYIDADGNVQLTISPKDAVMIDEATSFKNGLSEITYYVAEGEDAVKKTSSYDLNGNLIQEDATAQTDYSNFSYVGDFHDGYALAANGLKVGVIDESGAYVFQPQFDGIIRASDEQDSAIENYGLAGNGLYISNYSDGLFLVYDIQSKLFGYLDLDKNYVLQPQYEDAMDFGTNDLALVKSNGQWQIINKAGEVQTAVHDINQVTGGFCRATSDDTTNGFKEEDGVWKYYTRGVFQDSLNTIVYGTINDQSGWYLVRNGVFTPQTTVTNNTAGWWYVKDGKVDFTYNGIARNDYGWWRISAGKVNFYANDLAQNEYGWWKCKDGQVDFNYTGLASNGYGTWLVLNGRVATEFTGTYLLNGTTYSVENGRIN